MRWAIPHYMYAPLPPPPPTTYSQPGPFVTAAEQREPKSSPSPTGTTRPSARSWTGAQQRISATARASSRWTTRTTSRSSSTLRASLPTSAMWPSGRQHAVELRRRSSGGVRGLRRRRGRGLVVALEVALGRVEYRY